MESYVGSEYVDFHVDPPRDPYLSWGSFCVVPDECYRPWDLHPLSLVKNGKCAVTMLHECYAKRAKGRPIFEDGRKKSSMATATRSRNQKLKQSWMSYSLNWLTLPAKIPSRKGGVKMVSTAN